MRTRAKPEVPIETIAEVFLFQRLYPDEFSRTFGLWMRFIGRITWRSAKPLMATHPELVLSVVERVAAKENGSRDPEISLCLAKARHHQGDHEGALRELESLLVRSPHDVRVRHNAGLCLRALGRMKEAREAFDRVLAMRPDDARALRAIAELT